MDLGQMAADIKELQDDRTRTQVLLEQLLGQNKAILEYVSDIPEMKRDINVLKQDVGVLKEEMIVVKLTLIQHSKDIGELKIETRRNSNSIEALEKGFSKLQETVSKSR